MEFGHRPRWTSPEQSLHFVCSSPSLVWPYLAPVHRCQFLFLTLFYHHPVFFCCCWWSPSGRNILPNKSSFLRSNLFHLRCSFLRISFLKETHLKAADQKVGKKHRAPWAKMWLRSWSLHAPLKYPFFFFRVLPSNGQSNLATLIFWHFFLVHVVNAWILGFSVIGHDYELQCDGGVQCTEWWWSCYVEALR